MCDVPSSATAASPAGQISPDQMCPLEDGEEVHRGTSWDHFPAELRDVDRTIRLVLTKRTVQREILGGKRVWRKFHGRNFAKRVLCLTTH